MQFSQLAKNKIVRVDVFNHCGDHLVIVGALLHRRCPLTMTGPRVAVVATSSRSVLFRFLVYDESVHPLKYRLIAVQERAKVGSCPDRQRCWQSKSS